MMMNLPPRSLYFNNCITSLMRAIAFLLFSIEILLSISVRLQRKPAVSNKIYDHAKFREYVKQNDSRKRIYAAGNTTHIHPEHEVMQILRDRYRSGSLPGERTSADSAKVALCVEGGGMRGCVAAGAVAAISVLGLSDTIDVVYGSSAGAMVSAYFISRQFSGMQIYYDILPSAGASFIDKGKILSAIAPSFPSLPRLGPTISDNSPHKRRYGLQNLRRSMKRLQLGLNSSHYPHSAEVIKLDYLLERVMGSSHQLDWRTFSLNEQRQPLRIVASDARALNATVFSRSTGHYSDFHSLLRCIRASMLVPGVAGQLMLHDLFSSTPPDVFNLSDYPSVSHLPSHLAPVCDAFLTEPIPYRSAVREGASHCLVLRTRPDPSLTILGNNPGVYEQVIAKKFFEKYRAEEAVEFITSREHLHIYAEDVLHLNAGALGNKVEVDTNSAYLLPIAITDPTIKEVGQLCLQRSVILESMRAGCKRTLKILFPVISDEEISDIELDDIVDTLFPSLKSKTPFLADEMKMLRRFQVHGHSVYKQ